MNAQIQLGYRSDACVQCGQYLTHSVPAEKQRLATVQDHTRFGQTVRGGVLGYPNCRDVRCRWRDDPRLAAPALIGVLVHVAVIAGKVTAAVNL